MEKIGVPQPADILKASFRDTLKSLEAVEDKVLPIFDDAAKQLVKAEGGDPMRALSKTLALLSGQHKELLQDRSMLNA